MNTTDDFLAGLGSPEVSALKLTGDISLENRSYTVDRDLEIDLNGHSMTATYGSPLFQANGGKLTIKGNGTISNKGNVGIASNGGEIIVENGILTSSNQAVFRAGEGGTVTVNGGSLTGQEGAVDSNNPNGTIVINDGHLTGLDNYAIATNGSSGRGGNVITINGGTLEGNIRSAGYEAIGVYLPNNDTFVMNGGEIIAHGGTGICMRAGDVTINGGTITATNVDKDGNTVADGWIGDKKTVMTGCSAIIYHESANYPGKAGMKLTVNGGTITGVDHSIQVLSNEITPQVFVTGGVLTPAYPEPEETQTEP